MTGFTVKIPFTEYIGSDGEAIVSLPEWAKNLQKPIEMYRLMVLVRHLDALAVNLQRTGQLGTYASSLGAEAVDTGIGFVLKDRPETLFTPYYRQYAELVAVWGAYAFLYPLRYWGGDERGNMFADGKRFLPFSVPIGTQITHAVGAAYARQVRGEKGAVVAICGDGATSRPDFSDGLVFAGSWKLPVVLVINNNQWAISTPRSAQTAAYMLALRGIGYGVRAEQCDGNDPLAVYEAVSNACMRAEEGKGPTLIEAISYRLCNHTTADDAKRYVPEGELEAAWRKEPICRMQKFLEKAGVWNDILEEELLSHVKGEVERVKNKYLSGLEQRPAEDIVEHLYEQTPSALIAQTRWISSEERRNSHGH